MIEYTSRNGNTIWYATRQELERLPGYRGNDRKARACCPVHAGDNPTALDIDWGSGWAHCFVCGDAWAIRVGEPPQTGAGPGKTTPRAQRAPDAPERTHGPKTTPDTPAPNPAALARLQVLSQAWGEAYAGSPAAEYAQSRGIPDDIAAALGWGYVSDNPYLRAHHLFIPYTDPAGQLTGGAGRALDRTTHPKYLNLRKADGYTKTLVNGAAIAQARATRKPLVIVEGPFDAGACLAGGVPYVVALNGATARPAWFAGIPRVFLGFDADDAGREAVARFRRTVPVHAASFDADALEGSKDLGEFWQTHGRLPAALIAAASSQPDISQSDPEPAQAEPSAPAPAWLGPTLAELQARTAEAERYARLAVDDLPADIREEAETLGAELAADPEEAYRFMGQLLEREHTLAAEDHRAAWHALRCAVTAWPEPDPLEQQPA
jgi:hypothetical protein